MKKLMSMALSLLLLTGAFAQDDTGSINEDTPRMWLGGEVTFGGMSARDFTFGPSFGILLGEQIGVGGTVMYSSGDNSNAWNIEPFVRYYLPVVDRFSFFGDAFLGLGGGDNNTGADGGEYNTLDFGARLGLQFWFSPRWSMAASSNVLEYYSTDGDGEFGLGVDFSAVNFSFFFHF